MRFSHRAQVQEFASCSARFAFDVGLDMLGFKLEMPRREDNVQDKTRPIYLDMQVRFTHTHTGSFSHALYVSGNNTR